VGLPGAVITARSHGTKIIFACTKSVGPSGDLVVPLPHYKPVKATLQKVFILDAHGGYAGEYLVDENCLVEYSQFLAALPPGGIADQQTIFLGEWRATPIHGEKVSLVCISKGPLGPEEVTWAKAALVATETQLSAPPSEDEPLTTPGPDKGVMESLSRAITEREEQLASREAAFREEQERSRSFADAYRKEVEAKIADLRAQLEATRVQHEETVASFAAERVALRQEQDALAVPSEPAEGAIPAEVDPETDALRVRLEADRKFLEKYAHDLIARAQAVQSRELTLEEETAKVATMREELDALRAEVEAAKAAPPPGDWQAEKRELEMRIKILEQKALDLLEKEEKLREREKRLFETLKSIEA